MRSSAWLSTVLAVAAVLAAPHAGAVGRVLSADGSARVAELRIAVAASKQRRAVWSALRLQGNPGPVAVVLPVSPGALIDPAGDAWLGALDAATAPRIVPLGAPPGVCANAPRVDATTADEPKSRLQPVEVAELQSVDDVTTWATSHALAASGGDVKRLAASGTRFVGLLYNLTQGGGVTETIRVVEPAAAGTTLPLSLVADPGHAVSVVLFAVTSGAVTPAPGHELAAQVVDPLWAWHDGTSDFAERAASYLEQAPVATWLAEARGAALLSSYTVLPRQGGAIPPVIDSYFKRVAPADASQCVSAVAAARKLGWPVAAACPAGALGSVPDASGSDPICAETPSSGETDPATLRCDDADDLALALSGLRPDYASVTRLRGLVTASDPDPALAPSTASDTTPVITAKRVDAYGCGSLPGGGSGGAPGASGGGTGGSIGASQGGGSGDYGGGSDPYAGDPAQVDVNVGCSSSSGNSSACSGDSSSSSSSGSTCSGDSSSSSSSGSTCSGDSSSSSSSGSTCSGDSSSSSSDGNTCSGDSSSSSSDGATCSGDSSSSSSGCSGSSSGDGSSCSLSHQRARPRASILLLALAGLAFPLRRARKRG